MPRKPSNHVDNAAAVGARLKAARTAAGLSQRQLAFSGCTAAYVSRIEAGARVPSYQILLEFAKQLGVSADYLATGFDADTAEPDQLLDAEVALRLGELERAEQIYERIRESADSPVAAARAAAGLGHVAVRRGELDNAVELLEEALATEVLPVADASAARDALGRTHATQGRFEEAFEIFSRSLREAREREDQFDIIRFGALLANAYVDSGNFGAAQEVLGGVLETARQTLDPMLQAGLYWSQSRLYSSQGNLELAARYAQLTISTLKATEHTLQAARALLLLAHIENDRGNAQAALELVEEGEPVVVAAGDSVDRGMFTIERARALEATGDSEGAASLMLGAISQFREASPVTAARAYAAAANFFRSRGDVARALELYELAAEQFPAADRHLADVLTAMAEIHEQQGNTDKVVQLLKAALAARSGERVSVEYH